jgi:ATP-dependent Clp protease ATP-binding subunit ClpC
VFENYTESARRAIFFARYEASVFGATQIELPHLLLGVFRELPPPLRQMLPAETTEKIRAEIEKQTVRSEKISTSVDLPLSTECKSALDQAAKEAEELKQKYIAIPHLMLGILHLKSSLAARLLEESGVAAAILRKLVREQETQTPVRERVREALEPAIPDLVKEASARGQEEPFVGREREIEQVIRILCRRSGNSVALIGDAGVGKTAIAQAVAQRIALGLAPRALEGRSVLAVDAAAPPKQIPWAANPILFVRGLFDQELWGTVAEAAYTAQVIATGSPAAFRRTQDPLASRFEVVYILPPSEAETRAILGAKKAQYEAFHDVVIEDSALDMAILASRRFLPFRALPERALDLLDDACTLVKLRRAVQPPEFRATILRVRKIVRDMENAIGRHDFEEARRCSDLERQERAELSRLREQQADIPASKAVAAVDVQQAAADRAGVPLAAVQRVLAEPNAEPLDALIQTLAAQLPIEHRNWAAALAAHVIACSPDEAERLALAIRAARRPESSASAQSESS